MSKEEVLARAVSAIRRRDAIAAQLARADEELASLCSEYNRAARTVCTTPTTLRRMTGLAFRSAA